ncbi:Taurine catabolism dioxygenase TauD/TfdA [Metarhizium album ARSEF 1941]|uniref:Taurine catabolism dioxygenase TauD/TfdA n=1 Tax=Metarhizium album (strain ARSEF 1941) TaxID=1081103 RepID=A0A0B2WG61_METAS|nr:Taurine catabolism dioxygenase TauD/TfdA [Metarhizium album ARSEF 1941]KHN94981.1 Taurine catabolism dioxygenase TauD/TfdA [Metarhizium album ARSEF 1941]
MRGSRLGTSLPPQVAQGAQLSRLSLFSPLSSARSSQLLRNIHNRSSPATKLNLPSGQVTSTIAPLSSKYWPKYQIPEGAPQLIYEPKDAGPLTISWTNKHVLIQDGPGAAPRALRPVNLRDSCICPACKDASSGQKSFASTEIPSNIEISSVRPTDAGLGIRFSNDMPRLPDHETLLAWHHLRAPRKRNPSSPASKSTILARTGVQYWDAATLPKHMRKIDYADFMAGGAPFWDVVIDLCRLGIVYLKNVPRDESSVVLITTRIANIRETLYGRTFDVRAKPDAENVAYTSGYLGLHQDLCYLRPPPMIQVLHCMDNSCSGGESLFSDGERVGRLLWPFVSAGAGRMASLAEHKVPYQYDKHGHFYHADRSVVDGDGGRFRGVYWSPPFQGGYTDGNAEATAGDDMTAWIEAARVFEALVSDGRAVHRHKMAEGECVLFDNLRVMHGRTAFDAARGGARWLRGAYNAAEDFLSTAAHIPEGQADLCRGSEEWSDDQAQAELRRSEWWPDVVRRVREVERALG